MLRTKLQVIHLDTATTTTGSGTGCTVDYTVIASGAIEENTLTISHGGIGFAVGAVLTITSTGTVDSTFTVVTVGATGWTKHYSCQD